MVAGLAKFLKNLDPLESVFAVAGSLKNSPLGEQMVSLWSRCSKPLPAASRWVSRPIW